MSDRSWWSTVRGGRPRFSGGDSPHDGVLARLVARYRTSPRLSSVRAVAFWAAIVIPVIYLPLLATGLSSRPASIAFVSLLGLNVLALVAGYSHQP